MKELIKRKLKGNAGETIGETLIALLISALALVMLAGAISATKNMITRSNKQMADYYIADNNIATQKSSDGTLNISITGGNVSYTPPVDVKKYTNTTFSGIPVVSYGI